MNEKMKKLVKSIDNYKNTALEISIENLEKLFNPKFENFFDCITITDGDINTMSELEFNKLIKKMYTDKSGYEYACNETFINYYLSNESLKLEEILKITFIVANGWANILKNDYPDAEFCFVISCDEDSSSVTLRFHKMRANEGMVISSDLEGFNQPIAYKIC